ncbi:MAG: hypothetical protein ACT4PO_01805, partial [Actinomycetota bacterium]
AYVGPHLRPLPRCDYRCDRSATEELFNGAHALVARTCSRHARQALARFKKGPYCWGFEPPDGWSIENVDQREWATDARRYGGRL